MSISPHYHFINIIYGRIPDEYLPVSIFTKVPTKTQMACQTDSDCPFLFNCHADKQCYHDQIFPLQLYPCVIYLLFPIAVGMVNMTGNSMGIFKVFLLMNLLRYDIADSTAIIQPMVAGAALPNFFNIVMKKHPHWSASLVDFNIVIILIPCCLLGSTLGSFIQKFIPEIVQDLLVVLFFSYFTTQFIKKLKKLKAIEPKNPLEEAQESKDSLISTQNKDTQIEEKGSYSALNEQEEARKIQIQAYQRSIHLPDIAISFAVFIVFEFLVFLVQGKFNFYQVKVCSVQYFGGLALLIVATFAYLYLIKIKLRKQFMEYNRLSIPFNLDLSKAKIFVMIGLGGFSAGMVQGILGVGSGTFIMGVFLAFNLDPRVASATSGYQIFFIGAASFIQGYITNSISLKDALFLFGWCAIVGGAVTVGMYAYLKKKNQALVNKLLVTVITVLCIISVIGVFPSAIQTWMEFGWNYMIEVKFHC